jgi:hypothetical protein
MFIFQFNTVTYVFLLLYLYIVIVWLCIFIVPVGTLRLPWRRFYRAFSSVVRQMQGCKSQRRGTARTIPKFFVVLCIVCFVLFCLLFLCKCVLYYSHQVATKLQLTNISYHAGNQNRSTWSPAQKKVLIAYTRLSFSSNGNLFSVVK